MPHRKIPVAIVEDHELYRNALFNLIENSPTYTVTIAAENGKDFFEKQQHKRKPDIILLDLSMPEMDGAETIQWIGSRLPDAKVVVLSASKDILSMVQMYKMGAAGYIVKNSSAEEIFAVLDKVQQQPDYYASKFLKDIKSSKGPSEKSMFENLPARQLTFLQYACTDLSYDVIAKKMGVTRFTIDDYRDALFKKFKVDTRVGLVLMAIKHKIVEVQ